jgi:arginyl-tRNA synthetase
MSLLRALSDAVTDAFEGLGLDRSHGAVVVSQRPDLAQLQCNGALTAAQQAGRPPRAIASDVTSAIEVPERM